MQIQMPMGARTSIGHRVAGVLLVAAVPVSIYLFDLSLRSEPDFVLVNAMFENGAVRAVALILLWALSHHLLAGIRHLLSDFNLGSPLRVACRSASQQRLDNLNDAYCLFRCRTIMNCSEMCPRDWSPRTLSRRSGRRWRGFRCRVEDSRCTGPSLPSKRCGFNFFERPVGNVPPTGKFDEHRPQSTPA